MDIGLEVRNEVKRLVEEGGYTLDENGTITDPGKFEAEPAEILFFYDAMMNGTSDESGDGWDAFQLEEAEKVAFEVPEAAWAVLHHSDQGFESLEYGTAEEFESFVGNEPEPEGY